MKTTTLTKVRKELETDLRRSQKVYTSAEEALKKAKINFDNASHGFETAKSNFDKFSQALPEVTSTTTAAESNGSKPTGRRGRPAQAKTAQTASKRGPGRPRKTETVQAGKRGPGRPRKTEASKGAKTTQAKRAPRSAQGGDDKLTMIEAMVKVMGGKTMTAGDIEEGLNSEKLAPKSNNLRGYISSVLSIQRDVFEKVSRGQYRVKSTAKAAKTAKTAAAKEEAAESPVTETTEAAPRSAADVLAEIGLETPAPLS